MSLKRALYIAAVVLILVIAINSMPRRVGIVQAKGYRCDGSETYFWLDIADSRWGVNYDVWRANHVGQMFTKIPAPAASCQ